MGELQAPHLRAQCADEEQRQRASPDKRPRKHNTHEHWRQREAVMFVEASSKGLRDWSKADGAADTAQIR